jgi:hypothetical protein
MISMETGISDIQKTKDGNVIITFCVYPSCEDFLTITIDKHTAKEIADFWSENFSLAAQLKADKRK